MNIAKHLLSDKQESPVADLSTLINLAESSKVQYRQKIPDSQKLIDAHSESRYPQSAVALEIVENAVIVCAHRTIAAYYPNGQPITSCQIGNTKRARNIKNIRKRLDLKGSMALFTTLAPECYYHWLLDTVPGLEVLDAAGVSFENIDHFYFSNYCQNFQSETLSNYGIDSTKVFSTFTDVKHSKENILHAKIDKLLIPRFRDLEGGWPNQWIAPNLQSRFDVSRYWNDASTSSENRKIYITRGTSRRRVINEEELLPFLANEGFQLVDMNKLSLLDQIETVARADVICGPHGAGLATAIFARPGATLIEFCGAYLTRHFRITAEIAGLNYQVFGAGVDRDGRPLIVSNQVADRSVNYLVDKKLVELQLSKLTSDSCTKT